MMSNQNSENMHNQTKPWADRAIISSEVMPEPQHDRHFNTGAREGKQPRENSTEAS